MLAAEVVSGMDFFSLTSGEITDSLETHCWKTSVKWIPRYRQCAQRPQEAAAAQMRGRLQQDVSPGCLNRRILEV